jgi:ribosomal protein L44E
MVVLFVNLGLDMSGVKRPFLGQVRKAAKPMLHEIGRKWHERFLPRHFARDARQQYGYRPRDPEYVQDKVDRRKSRADNVFTGKSRRYAQHGERITATSRQVTIRFNKPMYRPEVMNDELTRVNARDKAQMQQSLLRHLQDTIANILKGR